MRARHQEVVDKNEAADALKPINHVIGSVRQHVAFLQISASYGEPRSQIADHVSRLRETLQEGRSAFESAARKLRPGALAHSSVLDTKHALDALQQQLSSLSGIATEESKADSRSSLTET